jgi:NAD+ diphosphatase
MFSCVAGFVDMGETLFDCARREVAEEIGLDILQDKRIKYMDSQFW